MVQQQALRDFSQAMANFFTGTHRRPTWRKAGRDEGFRIVALKAGHVRRLSRKTGEAWIPKAGWVRFRWSRAVPEGVKSYRVTLDRAGRWHIAFAAIPKPIPSPGTGNVVGIDRGVNISAALSTGEMLTVPGLSSARKRRLRYLQRKLSRAEPGSTRPTDLARRFDIIRVEDLQVAGMTRSAKGTAQNPGRNVRAKAGLNREILRSGWGLLVRRLEDKAPDRVERIRPHFTSQRCSACGHIAAESRKSQALFCCVACKFTLNADVNAAINIAAGHAVTARGGDGITRPVNREPQLVAS
jgi:putative transposase